MTFRVATFNIHHCEGADGRVDIERTASVIASTGAKLVALQEVDRNMARSGHIDQPAELERALGMQVFFWPSLHRGGGEYGNAIAADPAVTEARFVPLPQLGTEEPRGVITARWGSLGIICTHLSTHARSQRVQTPALAAIATGLAGPVVVLGDLNQPRRPGLNPLIGRGFEAAKVSRTLARSLRRRQIDHVVVSPHLTLVRAWTLKTDASDHLPLVADLEPSPDGS